MFFLPLFANTDISFLQEAQQVVLEKEAAAVANPDYLSQPVPEAPTENKFDQMKRVFVGYLGNTGHSTGPHLHIQTTHDRSEVTPEVFNSYFRINGEKVSWDDVTADQKSHEKRGSRGTDFAFSYEGGEVIEALEPAEIGPWQWDSRSGNFRWVRFENGFEALLAHLMDDQTPPKEQPVPLPTEKTPVPPSPSNFNIENAEDKLDAIISNLSFK
jgi:hypothetical protein